MRADCFAARKRVWSRMMTMIMIAAVPAQRTRIEAALMAQAKLELKNEARVPEREELKERAWAHKDTPLVPFPCLRQVDEHSHRMDGTASKTQATTLGIVRALERTEKLQDSIGRQAMKPRRMKAG